jgi:hypothetical protein
MAGPKARSFRFPAAAAILAGMAGELPGSAFVGRADELRRLDAVLDAVLDRAGQGRPQVVLVAGVAVLAVRRANRGQRAGQTA